MAPTPKVRPVKDRLDDQQGVQRLVDRGWSLVNDLLWSPRYYWLFTGLVLMGELFLGLLIIQKVPYTKIDWPAYMQQVGGFLDGQRDYSKLQGETGPLVYPAFHLYIYTFFHQLLPNSSFDQIRSAQYIFFCICISTILLIAWIYRKSDYPQGLLIPLTLSKRAHSVYLLRLFNDPLAMVLFYAGVVGMMRGGKGGWRVGSVLYSLALGVKMNILLFLPGLLVLLFQNRGVLGTIESISIIAIIQLALPAPFFLSLSQPYLSRSYFVSAFDFSRRFLYEWTVNWRFIPEAIFHSKEFASTLLGFHGVVLVLFAWSRWNTMGGGTKNVLRRGFQYPKAPAINSIQSPSHIPLILFTSNLIGMTFARSLHYQFQSWYFHQIPFFLYAGGAWASLPLGISLSGLLEWAWSTAPSTRQSSGVMLFAHVIILAGLYFRPRQQQRMQNGMSGRIKSS